MFKGRRPLALLNFLSCLTDLCTFFSLITCFEKQFEPAVSIFRKNNHEKVQAFSFIFLPQLKICVVVVQQQNNLFISHPVSLSFPLFVFLFSPSLHCLILCCVSASLLSEKRQKRRSEDSEEAVGERKRS